MKKLLHIVATPRAGESRTLKVSEAFLDNFSKKYPQCRVDTLNVSTENLPPLTVKRVDGKYVLLSGKELSGEVKEAWVEGYSEVHREISFSRYLPYQHSYVEL